MATTIYGASDDLIGIWHIRPKAGKDKVDRNEP